MMGRLLIKAKIESKNPEESRFINAFTEAVKAIRSNDISHSCFITEYNTWRQKVQSNITFLSESFQFFSARTSTSTVQRFFLSTFIAVCFLESIRSKNKECCLIGIFLCSLLALMSFITAVIGVLSTRPNKSIQSILNWICTMNVLSKEIHDRLKRTRIEFQITAGTDSLHGISIETNWLTFPRWKNFVRLFFFNFLSWFSLYGTVFAVQVCIVMKAVSFMDLGEVLKSFSLVMIFINALIQDIKIRKTQNEMLSQICGLKSETEKFLVWFHNQSDLGFLFEQYEFLKEPLLKVLKCENDINKITPSQSFILFAVAVIKVADGLQDNINSEISRNILRSLLFSNSTTVQLTSDEKRDNSSVRRAKNSLANYFLHLGELLKKSKLSSNISDGSSEKSQKGSVLPKILNSNQTQHADSNFSKKHVKKTSKIPVLKSFSKSISQPLVGNKNYRFNKVSDAVTANNSGKTTEKGKVTETEDSYSEKNQSSSLLGDLTCSPIVQAEKHERYFSFDAELHKGDDIASSEISDPGFKDLSKPQYQISDIHDGSLSSPLSEQQDKGEFHIDDKSEKNEVTRIISHSDKRSEIAQRNLEGHDQQTNWEFDVKLKKSTDNDGDSGTAFEDPSKMQLDQKQDSNRNTVEMTSNEDVSGSICNNKKRNSPTKSTDSISSVFQESEALQCKNDPSNISEDMVVHPYHAEDVLKENGITELSSISENIVLHVRKHRNKAEKETVKLEQKNFNEADQNTSISIQKYHHDNKKVEESSEIMRSETDYEATSNPLDKGNCDGQTAENMRVVIESISCVEEIGKPLPSPNEKKAASDVNSTLSTIEKTYVDRKVDSEQESKQKDKIERTEYSRECNGNTSTGESLALEEIPVSKNKTHSMLVSNEGGHDLIQGQLAAETDKSINDKDTYLNKTSTLKKNLNAKIQIPEKIEFPESKWESKDIDKCITLSGRDEKLKYSHLDEKVISESGTLHCNYFDDVNQHLLENRGQCIGNVTHEKIREAVLKFFRNRTLPNSPLETHVTDTIKLNQELLINSKGIKDKSEENDLHEDINSLPHLKNKFLTNEAPNYFIVNKTSVESDDNLDLELIKSPYHRKKHIKVREKYVSKSRNKPRKRKTISENSSGKEDMTTDDNGSVNNNESTDAGIATSDSTPTSFMSNSGEVSTENKPLVDPDHQDSASLISMMKSLSIDSLNHEPSNNGNSFMLVNAENNLKDRSNFSLGSLELSSKQNKKEQEKVTYRTSNVFKFGPTNRSVNDSEVKEPTYKNLVKSPFESHSTAKQIHQNPLNNFEMNSFERHTPNKANKASNQNLEKNNFESNITSNKGHHNIEFQRTPVKCSDQWRVEQSNNEKEKTSNSKSNVFVFGAPKLSMNDSKKEKLFDNFQTCIVTNENKTSDGSGKKEFLRGSLGKQSTELSSDSSAYSEILTNATSSGCIQLNTETRGSLKTNKKKERRRVKTKQFYENKSLLPKEENNASSNVMINEPQQISPMSSSIFEKEIAEQAEKNMKNSIREQIAEVVACAPKLSSDHPNSSPTKNESNFEENQSRSDEENASLCGKQNELFSYKESAIYGVKGNVLYIGEGISSNNKDNHVYNCQRNISFSRKENEVYNSKKNEEVSVSEEENPFFCAKQNEPFDNEANKFCDGKESTRCKSRENRNVNIEKRECFYGKQKELCNAGKIKHFTVVQIESLDGKENTPYNDGEKELCNDNSESFDDKDNALCNAAEIERFTDVQSESFDSKDNSPCHDGEKEHFTDVQSKSFDSKDNSPCHDGEKEHFPDVPSESFDNKDSSPCHDGEKEHFTDVRSESFDSKDNSLCHDGEKEHFPDVPSESFDSKDNSPCHDGEKELFTDVQSESFDSKENSPDHDGEKEHFTDVQSESFDSKDNSPCHDGEKELFTDVQSESFDSKENSPDHDGEKEHFTDVQSESCDSKDNSPCHDGEKEHFADVQSESFDSKENSPDHDGEKEHFTDVPSEPFDNKDNSPCHDGEKELFTDVQSESFDSKENSPDHDGEKEHFTDVQSESFDSKDNSPCHDGEKELFTDVQSESFDSKENSPDHDGEKEHFTDVQSESCDSKDNSPCHDGEKEHFADVQSESFDSKENSPDHDGEKEHFTDVPSEPFDNKDNSPCHDGEKEHFTNVQSESFDSKDNSPGHDGEKECAKGEKRESFDGEENAFFKEGENEQCNQKGNESCLDIKSKFCDLKENETQRDKENECCHSEENEHSDATESEPCCKVKKEHCSIAKFESCHSEENIASEVSAIILSEISGQQSLADEYEEKNKEKESPKSLNCETYLSATETLGNSKNNSTNPYLPAIEDPDNIKKTRSFEVTAALKIKEDANTLSESKLSSKNLRAMKEKTTSRINQSYVEESEKNQDMQTKHLEISYVAPNPDVLDRSNLQGREEDDEAGNIEDSGFYETDHKVSDGQILRQNSELNTCQNDDEELLKSPKDLEGNSSLIVSDKDETHTQLSHILADANPSELLPSENKECSESKAEDPSMLSEDSRPSSSRVTENTDLNEDFLSDENQSPIEYHSSNEKIVERYSGIPFASTECSSQYQSSDPESVNKEIPKRFRKRHKILERRSANIKYDSSDSDVKQPVTWNDGLASKITEGATAERTVCEVSTNENGTVVLEQNQRIPKEPEGYHNREHSPVCHLRYKNLNVEIFPPLTGLKLELECLKGKNQSNREINESEISESSSVSQRVNSEDGFRNESPFTDDSTEQSTSISTVSKTSGVIELRSAKNDQSLHFEDQNVILNYEKRNGNLKYRHLPDRNEIIFKNKNTKLLIETENIDTNE